MVKRMNEVVSPGTVLIRILLMEMDIGTMAKMTLGGPAIAVGTTTTGGQEMATVTTGGLPTDTTTMGGL
jgi:hypothetical protein